MSWDAPLTHSLRLSSFQKCIRISRWQPDIKVEVRLPFCECEPVIAFSFNVAKSIQAAKVLLELNGGDMDKYMFIKMLYLADRESLKKWGEPITGDSAVSMRYGPVLSTIYDLTKGDCAMFHEQWSAFIFDADEETNRVCLARFPESPPSELCRAEISILTSVFEMCKDWSWKKMRDYSHSLEEYDKSVGSGSKPIPMERILKAVGKEESEIEELAELNRQIRMAEMLFAES